MPVPATVTGVEPNELLASPQHLTDPSPRTAHVCLMPAPIATAVEMPETRTGVVRTLVSGVYPSWPDPLSPQQRSVASASRAQVKPCPALTEAAAVIPVTVTGVVLAVAVPSPSCPLPLSPQHLTEPLESRLQVCRKPALMPVAVVMPETATGASASVVVPFPSSPSWLSPQHRSVLFESRAQVWFAPALIATAVAMPDTATGVVPGSLVPLPS